MQGARRRTKRLCSGVLAGAALFVVCTPMSVSAAPSSVTPIVVCSVTRHGSTHSVFGYDNSGPTLSVGVGSSNHFSPGPADRGQPTTFASRHQNQRVRRRRPRRLTWTLDGVQVHTPGAAVPDDTGVAARWPGGVRSSRWSSSPAVLGALLFWRTRRLRVRTPMTTSPRPRRAAPRRHRPSAPAATPARPRAPPGAPVDAAVPRRRRAGARRASSGVTRREPRASSSSSRCCSSCSCSATWRSPCPALSSAPA